MVDSSQWLPDGKNNHQMAHGMKGTSYRFGENTCGEAKWGVTIDRKAGGLTNATTLNHLSLVTVNSSSVMALIMGVVFHVVHDGTCPDNLKNAFTSLKVTLCIESPPTR